MDCHPFNRSQGPHNASIIHIYPLASHLLVTRHNFVSRCSFPHAPSLLSRLLVTANQDPFIPLQPNFRHVLRGPRGYSDLKLSSIRLTSRTNSDPQHDDKTNTTYTTSVASHSSIINDKRLCLVNFMTRPIHDCCTKTPATIRWGLTEWKKLKSSMQNLWEGSADTKRQGHPWRLLLSPSLGFPARLGLSWTDR